ncbi:MAG TPA: ATP-binding protein [Bacillota bacterium]|nr:ATP-binding protein [Bacillota bacterium]
MNGYHYLFYGSEEYKEIRQEIKQSLKNLLSEDIFALEIALNEAVNNALNYGCPEKGIFLKIELLTRKIMIRIKDNGDGFCVAEKVKDANSYKRGNSEFLWKESGRGLFLIQEYVDIMRYNKRGNDLLLVKFIKRRG